MQSNIWAHPPMAAQPDMWVEDLIITAYSFNIYSSPFWRHIFLPEHTPLLTKLGIYVASGENCNTAISLGVGVASATWNNTFHTSQTLLKFHIHMYHGHTNKKRRRTFTLFPTGGILTPFLPFSMSHTLMNSYRFNTTVFTFSQSHPQTLRMKSYQKPLPSSYLVGAIHFDASP